jgi:flagellar basal body-associated protein FliL
MMPLLVAVVVTILLVMIAMGLALISRMVVAAQVTPVDASPVAEDKAAAADNESQSRRITSVTIVSPVTTAWYYPWYYPYTWYNTYYYR